MRTGRPPKPTALKILEGNPGKRALPKEEPHGTQGAPEMPRGLSKRAKTAWGALAPALEGLKVITHEDRMALELLCEAYAEWRSATSIIQRRGHTFTSRKVLGEKADGTLIISEYVQVRPEVAIQQNAWKRVLSGLQEFGLTPAARVRVKVVPTKEAADPLAQLLAQRAARRGA